jgi:carbon storage regulator CsrA
MHILSRKVGERVVVPHADVAVTLVEIRGNVVRLGISTPDAGHRESLAAELTRAAYHAALQHATAGTWLDLQLDIWRALSDAVNIAGTDASPGSAP